MPNADDNSHLPEDKRIRMVVTEVVVRHQTVELTIADEARQVARYTRKLMARGCAIISIVKGPDDRVTIRVGPRGV